jgi:anti-sigma-K factor RskA
MLMYEPAPYAAPPPPSVAPVVGWTLAFGPFGAISAGRRADHARLLGHPATRYWVAFGVSLAVPVTVVVGLIVAVVVALAAKPAVMTTDQVEAQIAVSGAWQTASGRPSTVTDAACVAMRTDAAGVGVYRCLVTFSTVDDGARNPQSYQVTVARDGTWKAV